MTAVAVHPAHSCALDRVPELTLEGRAGAPVIVVLGGISATRHVRSRDALAPGWWSTITDDGGPLEPARARVLGMDFLDGGAGQDGRPRAECTTHDQADALARVLDIAGVDTVQCVIGASYGGMVALAFAERYPARVERLVVIGAAHQPHPMSTALRSLQRRIVELGLDSGCAHDALSIARGLAMTTYRTAEEFEARFAVACGVNDAGNREFESAAYLRRHGERFARSWQPSRFLALSLSCDTHRVDPARIATQTLLISFERDAIAPPTQVATLARLLGERCSHITLESQFGHDAFLLEQGAIAPLLEDFLSLPRPA